MDLLHNKNYLKQLEIWRVCDYDVFQNTIVNPSEPREKWRVEKPKPLPGSNKGDNERPVSKRIEERVVPLSDPPHRFTTIAEVEQEVHRIMRSLEESEGQSWTIPQAFWGP